MRLIDRTGDRYGRLVVLERGPHAASAKDTNARWLCQCDCGKTSVVYGQDLKRGKVVSCGCWNSERIVKHSLSRSHIKMIYYAMHQRCGNPKDPRFGDYGGRGISVCDRWSGSNGLVTFVADMGDRPKGYTIDRINNDGNYEPDNCRWATYTQQLNNRRNNKMIEFDGQTKTMGEWSDATGIGWHTLRSRIDKYGWSAERALTTPVSK